MGKEIKAGLDSTITEAQDITGSDAGWAAKIAEVADGLHSSNNALGSAALADIGTAAGNVAGVTGSPGKIATSLIDTALAGGSAAAGKIPLLSATGILVSSMLPSSSSGLKWIWKYDSTEPGGSAGAYSSTDRQWSYTWRPRRRQSDASTYTDVTSILVFVTGGGGSGSYGPDSSVSNGAPGGGSIAGHSARKGGGGGAGSTAIPLLHRNHLGFELRLEGRRRRRASPFRSKFRLALWGEPIPLSGLTSPAAEGKRGRLPGTEAFRRLRARGDTYIGIGLYGGSGHDGTFDRLGAGSGGASFWGGGYSGGGGREGTQTAAPGAGGGAANGSIGVSPYTFTARRSGHRGNDGIVLILGF